MPDDEIMRDIRAIRDRYAREFNYDAWALFRDAKKREGKSGRKVVPSRPKKLSSVKSN